MSNDDDLIFKIGPIIEQLQQLAKDALPGLSNEVDIIIATNCKDEERVEHLLDDLLNFAFYDKVLAVFKKLCRYWFSINPELTANYINAYREMYDDDNC